MPKNFFLRLKRCFNVSITFYLSVFNRQANDFINFASNFGNGLQTFQLILVVGEKYMYRKKVERQIFYSCFFERNISQPVDLPRNSGNIQEFENQQ